MFIKCCVFVMLVLRTVTNCPSLKKSKIDLLKLLELIVESFPSAYLLELRSRFDRFYFSFALLNAQVAGLHHTESPILSLLFDNLLSAFHLIVLIADLAEHILAAEFFDEIALTFQVHLRIV